MLGSDLTGGQEPLFQNKIRWPNLVPSEWHGAQEEEGHERVGRKFVPSAESHQEMEVRRLRSSFSFFVIV